MIPDRRFDLDFAFTTGVDGVRFAVVPFDIDSGEVTGEPRLISGEVAFQDPNGLILPVNFLIIYC